MGDLGSLSNHPLQRRGDRAHLNKLKAWRRRRGPAVVWVKLWILVLVHQGSSAPNATRDTNLRDGQPLIYTVKKIYSSWTAIIPLVRIMQQIPAQPSKATSDWLTTVLWRALARKCMLLGSSGNRKEQFYSDWVREPKTVQP